MSVNALVQTRIDIAVKEEAAHVLAAMALTDMMKSFCHTNE